MTAWYTRHPLAIHRVCTIVWAMGITILTVAVAINPTVLSVLIYIPLAAISGVMIGLSTHFFYGPGTRRSHDRWMADMREVEGRLTEFEIMRLSLAIYGVASRDDANVSRLYATCAQIDHWVRHHAPMGNYSVTEFAAMWMDYTREEQTR